MTREEAILWLKVINTKEFGWDEYAMQDSQREIRERCEQGVREAIGMAIEALSQPIVAKHFDIQSGYIYCSPQIAENVKVVVRCKDCRWWNSETKGCKRNPSVEAWYETDFCKYGERQCNYFGERREE